MSGGPEVSVIAIFDRGEFEPCMSSLLEQEEVNFEIIAVVSEKMSGMSGWGHPLPSGDRVRLLAVSDRNPARRRNLAAAEAGGGYLAFIDDDATAPPDWLKKGVEFLEDNPDVAGVGGPNLIPEDAGFRERVTDMVLTTPLIGGGSRAYRGGGTLAPARPGEVHLVNFILRKEWFDKVGGFNEAMGYGAEDTEFLYIAGKLGAAFMFDPSLIVSHRRRPFGPSYFSQRFRLRAQSARLFAAYPGVYIKNLSFIAAILALPALALSFALVPFFRSGLGLLALSGTYAALTIVLSFGSWMKMPALVLIAPVAFFLHHLVYLAGLWRGIPGAMITGAGRVRRDQGS